MLIQMTLLAKTQKKTRREDLPAFVYFEKILEENVIHFMDITKNIPARKCLYSVKAASFPFLLNILSKHLDGFDASSVTEAELIHEVLGAKSNMYITSPALTESEVKRVIKLRPKCVHLDSLHSLELFLKITTKVPVGLRINPGIGFGDPPLYKAGGKKSRLGIPLYELDKAFAVCRKYGLKKVGLHFHIACQAKTLDFHAKTLHLLSRKISACCAKGLLLTHVDLGGGIFPPLWNFEKDELIPSPLSVESIDCLSSEATNFVKTHGTLLDKSFSFLFEPGDFLVGSSAIIISRVIELRRDFEGTKHLILDSNINHYPNLIRYGFAPRAILPKNDPDGEQVKVSGNSCVGGASICTLNIKKPEAVKEVIFSDRGTYEYSELSFFNGRLRPSVLFLDRRNNLITVKKDSLQDLAGYWKEDTSPFPARQEFYPNYENIMIKTRGLYLYHPKLKYISSFDLDAETFPLPQSLPQAFVRGFKGYYNQYGRTCGVPELRSKIAEYENAYIRKNDFYEKDNAVVTLGAANAFWLLIQSMMVQKLQRLLIHSPNYYQFTTCAKISGVPWASIHKDVKLAELPSEPVLEPSVLVPEYAEIVGTIEDNPDTKMVAISDPGLPYGRRLREGTIKKLAKKARKEDWILIVDEALGEMPHFGKNMDWSWLRHSMPVIRLKSFSKTFGMSGLRLGYLTFTESLKGKRISGSKFIHRIEAQIDMAYESSPAIYVPPAISALELLKDNLSFPEKSGDSSTNQFRKNIALLKERAEWSSNLLSAYSIPHIKSEYAYTMMSVLPKLGPYPKNNFDFFRALAQKHNMFFELGGIFIQNPEWDFTIGRIGLGRSEKEFKNDLETFCRFYKNYRRCGGNGRQ